MATVTTDNAHYAAIAEAIRSKTGGTDTYTPEQMAAAIAAISGGGDQVEEGSFVAGSTGNITIPCAFDPDVIVITREEPLNTEGDVKGIVEVRIIKNWFSGGRYIPADGATTAVDGSREWSPSGYGSFELSYSDGVISGLPVFNGRKLQDGYAYNYLFGGCGL